MQQRALPPGFGAIYLPFPQTVRVHADAGGRRVHDRQRGAGIHALGQPSYGADGAGGLRLTLRDVNLNVLASVP